MGRTIPSFRIASIMEENEWKSFRDSLAKSERKIFDNMLVSGFGGIHAGIGAKSRFLE
jgi:hypothetical protein